VVSKTNLRECSTTEMVAYSSGQCANSLIFNGLLGFAMLYYTDALGVSHLLAGLALSLGVFWDAALDPIMGHISDTTRCRYGRRHPFILIGGLIMAVSFYFMWAIPDIFKTNTTLIFWYLVAVSLFLRTAYAAYSIPYGALGFEICTDYMARTKLQGIGTVMNMAANLCGPALAWMIFFQNENGVRATNVPDNFVHMGTVFAIASGACVLLVFFLTLKYMQDSRQMLSSGKGLKGFVVDLKEIVTDIYSRWVFAYTFVVIMGVALVSSLQMYVYEHFMQFSGTEKTIAHGGSMVGMALGSLLAVKFVKRWDKKKTVILGCLINVVCHLTLAVLFLPGLLKPGQTITVSHIHVPIAFIIFVIFHPMYYFGAGVLMPVATSMVADISEIHQLKSGINKDGTYSAMFVFAVKCSMSLALLFSGYCLKLVGFATGKDMVQSPVVIWRLCAIVLIVGPLISITALPLIAKYRVSKGLLEQLRKESDEPVASLT